MSMSFSSDTSSENILFISRRVSFNVLKFSYFHSAGKSTMGGQILVQCGMVVRNLVHCTFSEILKTSLRIKGRSRNTRKKRKKLDENHGTSHGLWIPHHKKG